ncbi:MAG: Pvc16 family protein [Caldilineaceae bacterium]
MIDDLDRTIKKLLEEELPKVRDGQVDVAFAQPNRDWKRDKAALNFFLYDMRQNATLRQHQWQEQLSSDQRPMRTNQLVPMQRTPLRLDCFYMVTAWSNDPVDEHRLLIECLATLARYPVLNRYEQEDALAPVQSTRAGEAGAPTNGHTNGTNGAYLQRPLIRDYLVGALRNLSYEIPTRLAEHDVLTNPAEVWGSLENSMKVAFSYVVTLPISPWLPMTAPAVETAEFRVGPTAATPVIDPATGKPQGPPVLARIAGYDRLVMIGGVVRDALQNGEPVADVVVQMKENGVMTRTDAEGRFRLPRVNLEAGEVTLVVDPKGEQPTEKVVRVPVSSSEQYDVTINIVSQKPRPRRGRKQQES